MALFYSAKQNGVATMSDVEIHVGNTSGMQAMRRSGEHVVSVQADGDELEAIKRQFSGIRMHNGRVVEWFGDDAKFIAMHLK